jgi:acetyl-CoA carboxylase carboxyltransferase component
MELDGEARAAFVRERREEFQKDIDVYRLASEMLVDAVVPPSELRGELIKRLGYAATKTHRFPPRRNGVYPV